MDRKILNRVLNRPFAEWQDDKTARAQMDIAAKEAARIIREQDELLEKMTGALLAHRANSKICCDETCFCWIAAEILETENGS